MSEAPRPALATLRHERFWDEEWVYERKLDGQRCLAVRDGGRTPHLYSRNGRDDSATFPEVVTALTQQAGGSYVIDGEIVAFDGAATSFSRLQPRINLTDPTDIENSGIAVCFYVFDLLELGGEDLRDRPLVERKKKLFDLVDWTDPLRWTPHRNRGDEDWFREICSRGWEGLIAKRRDSTYPSDRTKDWLKFKCEAGQELVIVGFTEPQGQRVGLGALMLGYYDYSEDTKDLVYAGKVGTGFSEDDLGELHEMLRAIEIPDSACTKGRIPREGHWVEPEHVAEVAFTEWTAENQLRHPRYLGLRNDKRAEDVVKEA